jgi:hypothetical protein
VAASTSPSGSTKQSSSGAILKFSLSQLAPPFSIHSRSQLVILIFCPSCTCTLSTATALSAGHRLPSNGHTQCSCRIPMACCLASGLPPAAPGTLAPMPPRLHVPRPVLSWLPTAAAAGAGAPCPATLSTSPAGSRPAARIPGAARGPVQGRRHRQMPPLLRHAGPVVHRRAGRGSVGAAPAAGTVPAAKHMGLLCTAAPSHLQHGAATGAQLLQDSSQGRA